MNTAIEGSSRDWLNRAVSETVPPGLSIFGRIVKPRLRNGFMKLDGKT